MATRRKATRARRSPDGTGEYFSLDREAVRHWRLQRGWTQEALARQRATVDGETRGLSYTLIRRIESEGRCGPTSARILAELLQVPLSSLAPRDHRQRPCGLPREPSIDFVGREVEIKDVLSALSGQSGARSAASIEGPPGIGKTELALQVCAVCEAERRFWIFWFDAEQPDLTSIWADVVAPHLGIEAPRPEQRARRALRAIESLAEPVLLVLDNVEDWSASTPWPRPRGRHIHWLITTRRSALGGREFYHVEVPMLERGAAEQLMVRIAGQEITQRPGLGGLLDTLDGYTISVEIAATFLQRFPDVDPADYQAELASGCGEELGGEVEALTFYGRGLELSLELLWERLPDRVRRNWLVAAQFAQALASPELSDACGLDRRVRAELRDYHLIELSSRRGWSMHRLVRAFGRAHDEPARRAEARRAFLRGCVERTGAVNALTGFQVYVPDRDHFDSLLETPLGASADEVELLCRLWERVAMARFSLGEIDAGAELLRRAIELGTPRLAPETPVLTRLRATRAWGLLLAGEPADARALIESTLASALGERGLGSHEYVAELLAVHGYVLRALGEFESAKTRFRAAFDVYELSVGTHLAGLPEDHPRQLSYRGSLGYLLSEAGELGRARELLEGALHARESQHGADPIALEAERSNLARLLLAIGDLHRARELLASALETARIRLGDQHPVVADRRSLLATVLFRTGDLTGARDEYERALEARSQEHPGEPAAIAAVQRRLATVVRELGDTARARALAEEALATTLEQGEPLRRVSRCRLILAWIQIDLGEFEGARDLLETSLAAQEEHSDADPLERVRSWHALGVAQEGLGDGAAARESLERALAALPQDAPQALLEAVQVRTDLAAALCALGDLAGAQQHLEGALEAQAKAGHDDHPESARARARLADVLARRGERADAQQQAREALRIARLLPPEWFRSAEIERHCTPLLGE